MMNVSVLIVTYNSSSVIAACLRQLDWAQDVIVVDNSSTDATVDIARQSGPHVRVVVNDRNMGFGRANNMAAALARYDHLLFLNADAVVDVDQVRQLQDALALFQAAMVSPLLLNESGKPELRVCAMGETISQLSDRFDDVPGGPACMVFLTGAVWLWRRQAWQQLGGFDPNIKLYWEDMDICLRAWQSRMPMVLVPGIRVTHLMGRSTAASYAVRWIKEWNMTWGRFYILDKYGSNRQARDSAWAALRWYITQTLFALVQLRRGAVVRNWAAVCGSLAYLRGKTAFLEDMPQLRE